MTISRKSVTIPELIENSGGIMNQYLPYSRIAVDTLPSKGIYYTDKNDILFQTFSLNQIKKFALLAENFNLAEAINLSLPGIETKFDINELLYEDLQFINFLRKVQALQVTEFTIPVDCSKCGSRSSLIAKPTDIEFTDIEIDDPEEASFNLTNVGGESSITRTLLPPSVYTILQIEAFKNYDVKEDPLEIGVNVEDTDMRSLILALNIAGGNLEEDYHLFDNIFGIDNAEAINEASNKTDFGLLNVNGSCEVELNDKKICGGKMITNIATIFSVILPFRGNERHSGGGGESKKLS